MAFTQMPVSSLALEIDQKVQTIEQIERDWHLPQLPHEVKLDLATQSNLAPSQISEFLSGLGADIDNQMNRRSPLLPTPAFASQNEFGLHFTEPLPADPAVPVVKPFQAGLQFNQRAKNFAAGIAGEPQPQLFDPESVIAVKTRAKELGLLPDDYPVDSTWSPDMNRVYAELSRAEFEKRVSGDRPGAMTIGSVLDKANEWLSPSFLFRTAVELDFIPNVTEIKRELADWPNKWERWLDDPSDVGNLADALTGPIDDVVVPIVNTGLLLSGVGGVYTFGRFGAFGAKTASTVMRAGSWGHRARSLLLPGAYRAADAVAEAQALARPGLLASTLLKNTRAGGVMAQWRQIPAVMIGRKATQAGMRLGQVGLLEANLFPEAEYTYGIRRLRDYRTKNPNGFYIADLFVDRLLVPVNIWPAGFFTGPIRSLRDRSTRQWAAVAAGSLATEELARVTASSLERIDPTQAMQFRTTMRKKGPVQALLDYHGGGEDALAKVGQRVTWAALLTAIDSQAIKAANTATGGRKDLDPAKWWRTFYQWRNQKVAEVRAWDPNRISDYVDYTALHFGKKDARRIAQRVEAGDPRMFEEFALEVERHNGNRVGLINNLLDELQPGMIEEHMANQFEHLNDWDAWVASTGDLDEWIEAGAQAAPGQQLRYLAAVTEGGKKVGLRPDRNLDLVRSVAPGLREEAVSLGGDAAFSPLVAGLDPSSAGWVIMRNGSLTRQDAMIFLNQVSRSKKRITTAQWLADRAEQFERDVISPVMQPDEILAQVKERELIARARRVLGSKFTEKTRDALKLRHWMARNDVAIHDVVHTVKREYEELGNHELWAMFGIAGELPTEQKFRKLWALRNWMASRVEGAPEQLVDSLGSRGYFLAHGAHAFLMPKDVMDVMPELADASRLDRFRHTLGRFTEGMPGDFSDVADYIGRLRNLRFRQSLFRRLEGLRDTGKLVRPGAAGVDESGELVDPDLNRITDLVRDMLNLKRTSAQETLDLAKETGGVIQKSSARLNAAWAPTRRVELSWKEVRAAIAPEYGDEVARHVYQSVKDSFWLGLDETIRLRGLAGIEDYLRSRSPLTAGLQLLSRTASGTRLRGAVAGALVGAAAANEADADPGGQLLGAALGAAGGRAAVRATGQGFTPGARVASGALGAILAGATAGAAGDEDTTLERLVGFGAGYALGPRGAKRLASLVEDSNWDIYTRLTEPMFKISQTLRFTLSPVFDMQRYIEGSLMAHAKRLTNEMGQPIAFRLPSRLGRKPFISRLGEEKWDEMYDAYRSMLKRAELDDLDMVDETVRIFSQEGLLGFSPVDQKVSVFGYLHDAGVSRRRAFEIAEEIFDYGKRTPLEYSINALFFPFSYVKKFWTSMAGWLTEDLTRSLLVHDALRTFEVLNDRFDLTQELRDHLPLAKQLRRINPFAFGLSLGEFGGINRPFLDLFIPVGMRITHGEGPGIRRDEVSDLMRRVVPAYRDISALMEDLEDQHHVVFGPQHLSKQAEITQAQDRLYDLRREADIIARRRGFNGWSEAQNLAQMTDVKVQYDRLKSFIEDEHPAWQDVRAQGVEQGIRNSEEAAVILATLTPERRTALLQGTPPLTTEEAIASFELFVDGNLNPRMALVGANILSNPEDVPEAVFQDARNYALHLTLTVPEFEREWRRRYRRLWGPIQRNA